MSPADRLIKDVRDFMTFDLVVRQMGPSFANDLARKHPEIKRTAAQWAAFWTYEGERAA